MERNQLRKKGSEMGYQGIAQSVGVVGNLTLDLDVC